MRAGIDTGCGSRKERGRGAADAAYNRQVRHEHDMDFDEPHTGGAGDARKCYDCLHRELSFTLARMAGMPARILDPYTQIIESLKYSITRRQHTGLDQLRLAYPSSQYLDIQHRRQHTGLD